MAKTKIKIQKNLTKDLCQKTNIGDYQEKQNGFVRICLIVLSNNVGLSCSVQVEGSGASKKTPKILMIENSSQCNRRSITGLHKSKLDSLMFDEDLKPDKANLSWMTRIIKVLKPEITVYFGKLQVPPMLNTVDNVLTRYFSHNPPTKRETMAYELLRLCTLHDFPKSTGQSCIRLAQAAFFYEGKDDQVTCFSCSIQICGWQPRDIPLDRHRETSPNCLFIKCQDSGNVPICHTGSTSETTELNEATSTVSGFETVPSSAPQSSNSKLSVTKNSNYSGYSSKNSSTCQPSDSSSTSNSQPFITTPASSSRTGTSDTQPAAQYTITSTNRSRAHYPEYVLVNDRLQSFNRGWPDYVRQTPQMMVESGFFFAGYEDCVRCFQCGIGLRNWEPPDSPHVEHARWSPKCPFLLSVKGQDFINLVLDAVAQLALKNEQSANTPPAYTESSQTKAALLQTSQQAQARSATTRNPVKTGSSSNTTGSVDETSSQTSRAAKSSLQSVAIETEQAKTVLRKGFSENEVKRAIEKIVDKDGWANVTETSVLQTIQEEKKKERKHPPGLRGGDANMKMTTLPPDIMELRKKNREMREMTICKICLEEEVSIVFLPCGHLVACAQCAPALSRCAVCRKPITGTVCAHLDV